MSNMCDHGHLLTTLFKNNKHVNSHTTKQLSFSDSALETVSFGIFAVFDENTLLHFCVIILNFSSSWNRLPSVSGL